MDRINSTRFTSQEELAALLLPLDLKEQHFEAGGVPLMVKDGKVYVDASDSHTMIYGATGSKKTRMFAMPSIGIFARGNESFVVTDPKGELYERTAGDVQAYGYDVQCMNLRCFKEGFSWNPLALPYEYYHYGRRVKAMEFVTEMAKMIIGDSAEEAFWINTSADIFVGFVLLLFELSDKKECNLRSLVEIWNHYLKHKEDTVRFIKEKYGNTMIYQKISSLDNASDRTVGSIEAFINMGLNKLTINEEFMNFLSQEGVNLEQMTENKMALYLVIPDENKSYHFVVSLFLEQLYEILIHKAQSELEQKLPCRMNFLIDEFGNIPKIENMEAMITASRSRNIRFHLIVQGMKQLRQKYGEGAEIISGNCNNWVYLYSKEYELLQDISRLCGEVIYDNNIRMPLFSEFDLQHLSKEKGEALVLAGRSCPCISNLADIEEYPFEKKELPPREEKQEINRSNIFNFERQRDNYYDYPIEEYEIAYFCGVKSPERPQWVVGVGPEGIILVEGLFAEKHVRSEYAFHKLLEKDGFNEELVLGSLEWYSGNVLLEDTYTRMLKEKPEKVYLTLDELGRNRFRLRKAAELQSAGCYLLEAQIWDDEQDAKGENILEVTLDGYGGFPGALYAHNVLFRKMNELLADTKFEELSWKRTSSGRNKKNGICFEKRINDKNKVIARIYQEQEE